MRPDDLAHAGVLGLHHLLQRLDIPLEQGHCIDDELVLENFPGADLPHRRRIYRLCGWRAAPRGSLNLGTRAGLRLVRPHDELVETTLGDDGPFRTTVTHG